MQFPDQIAYCISDTRPKSHTASVPNKLRENSSRILCKRTQINSCEDLHNRPTPLYSSSLALTIGSLELLQRYNSVIRVNAACCCIAGVSNAHLARFHILLLVKEARIHGEHQVERTFCLALFGGTEKRMYATMPNL